ncbi:hypothetical protein [Pedobacter sp. L105]|uniref:hypothetical protein n=1 Tax=Pedobacter sp. L105 TaxID=1641871 RepID=UPI00131C27BC|nr:hypothetical protein [Pedobacter sp. L105]
MLRRRILLCIAILLGFSLYYFVFRAGSARELDIINFPWDRVSAFEVSDRGIFGNKKLRITDPDSILYIRKMILKSTKVSFNSINFKSSMGHCTVEIIYNDGKKDNLELSNTSEPGGILSSGDYYYRNDDFLKEIIWQLKSTYR